ncbi:MAG: EthD family reductase [Rhodanobacteraceae bacterium]|nr:EthD family reductase [Rhodanobacteraceae bacterium]HPF73889.1 EthD family reductase [Xanthomonadaceae bacterium]HRX98500.1 EthD family reductase [Xanthomonadaceae bacterium]
MAKLIVLYKKPSDVQAFNEYYFSKHVPIASTIPGLEGVEVSDGPVGSPQGESPYHLVATLSFASMEALQAAMASPEGQKTAADLANFADGGAEILIINPRSL